MRAMPRRLRQSLAPLNALEWNSSTKTAVAPACGSASGNTKKARTRAARGTADHAKLCVDTHWWLLFYETKPMPPLSKHPKRARSANSLFGPLPFPVVLCFAPPNSLFILGREFPRKRLSFVADWRRDGAPEAPFPTFSLYFSLFEGKARFWSVGLHHPDMHSANAGARLRTARPSSGSSAAGSSGTALVTTSLLFDLKNWRSRLPQGTARQRRRVCQRFFLE